ncbi:hypothetical protein OIU79_025414 [Salix purpurea]|uniref:Uncharacterized protein n=1 Tax=Salix purpurea TaxID=77065 RepID=A0A9Q0W5K3_SALPP|nr:hypothetical protein OIU79_025414 [Salix purpurea]
MICVWLLSVFRKTYALSVVAWIRRFQSDVRFLKRFLDSTTLFGSLCIH